MLSKVTEQTKRNPDEQHAALQVNSKTIRQDHQPPGLERLPLEPATDQQRPPTLSRADSYTRCSSYNSRSIFAFLVMKL